MLRIIRCIDNLISAISDGSKLTSCGEHGRLVSANVECTWVPHLKYPLVVPLWWVLNEPLDEPQHKNSTIISIRLVRHLQQIKIGLRSNLQTTPEAEVYLHLNTGEACSFSAFPLMSMFFLSPHLPFNFKPSVKPKK